MDLVVLDSPYGQETLKRILVDHPGSRFYLVDAKTPGATYKVRSDHRPRESIGDNAVCIAGVVVSTGRISHKLVQSKPTILQSRHPHPRDHEHPRRPVEQSRPSQGPSRYASSWADHAQTTSMGGSPKPQQKLYAGQTIHRRFGLGSPPPHCDSRRAVCGYRVVDTGQFCDDCSRARSSFSCFIPHTVPELETNWLQCTFFHDSDQTPRVGSPFGRYVRTFQFEITTLDMYTCTLYIDIL